MDLNAYVYAYVLVHDAALQILFSHFRESMGGAVCIQAARREPSLFAGLVLMAPMTGESY